MKGILYGIGVGPGDPRDITLKALDCIKQSDVIILPTKPKEECHAYRIVQQVYPEIEQKKIVCLPFLMVKDQAQLQKSHDEIYQQIADLLNQDKQVGFLTIGDPSIYATYSYIHKRVLQHHGRAQMISGVPSFCAVAAALGISLGEQREEIHIIPSSYPIEHTAAWSGTKIYMKSGKKMAELKQLLSDQQSQQEVYAVSNCGMPDEQIMHGIAALDENSPYLTVVIVKEKRD